MEFHIFCDFAVYLSLSKVPRRYFVLLELETELQSGVTMLNKHHGRVSLNGRKVHLRRLTMDMLLLQPRRTMSVPSTTPRDPVWKVDDLNPRALHGIASNAWCASISK